jgi:peptidoglycan hydrolase CwlO-like protein
MRFPKGRKNAVTDINTFQDILDALEQDPALREQLRRHILTEELLQLPAAVQELRTDVAELKNGVTEIKTDVAELKNDVTELKTDVAELSPSSRMT